MALSSYTRTQLVSAAFDDTIVNNLSSQVDIQDAVNRAAREVWARVKLKGAKRFAAIAPNVFDDVYQYTAPSDLNPLGILDIRPQNYPNRKLNSRVRLVTPEVFDRKKGSRDLLVSVFDDDIARTLLIDIDTQDTKVVISKFDSLTSDGSNWAAFNDSTAIEINNTNKIAGGGSIEFDLVGSATTAGVYNAGLTVINVGTEIFTNGYTLVWVYINSTTNLTNFILRLGNDASNYHQETETVDSAGNAFVNGWNLLRFNWVDKVTTGTVDPSAIDYCALYMTKTSGKSDDGYRFDDLVCHTGEIYNIHYFSKFPWQTDTEAYAQNSAGGTDYINVADVDEIDLVAARVQMEVYRRLRDFDQYNMAKADYEEKEKMYKLKNPDQSLKLEAEWYRLP